MKYTQMQAGRLPELLCPAGSPLALLAAIEGGADALYLGGLGRNARMNAKNFDAETLRDGIRHAHAYGVKVYMTMNTLVYDREMADYIKAAAEAQDMGVDALIVADLGAANAIHRALPELALHASTQAGVHGADAGELLARLGFSRMVVARELPLQDLKTAVERSPIEIEGFIHGALCVCHSGSCLFSSMVGGRSGNRGECAQPCRLPYRTPKGKSDYPLSLKDLSLARHVPELIESGLASLKIEGRMRSPEYVLAVTRIWRTLLDERRGATEEEMQLLGEAFSRDGFTDGYFTGRLGPRMLGVRSEADKQAGRALSPFGGLTRRVPLDLFVTLQPDLPATLSVKTDAMNAPLTVEGEVPQAAINAPLDEETVRRQMSRLGNTPYAAHICEITLAPGLMLPISALNALRRSALEQLERTAAAPLSPAPVTTPAMDGQPQEIGEAICTASMTRREQLTVAAANHFDVCYLPIEELLSLTDEEWARATAKTTLGVTLPPVIMDHERERVRDDLKRVFDRGIRRASVGNLGHLSLVKELGMIADGDVRLNVTNAETLGVLAGFGVERPILSPELTLPRLRDLAEAGRVIVYGRLPLMLLEKCVIREIADCDTCHRGQATLVDRRGSRFPVLRTPDHRNVIYNSLPTEMSDRQDLLDRYSIRHRHFLFTVESPAEVDAVLRAFQTGVRTREEVRRINQS